ncbi:MAG: GGDEF domain-containing protein [Coriobacteriia bacterium]|nr:GGDEF domain-containing protein [Coriobacteriia bacterium]
MSRNRLKKRIVRSMIVSWREQPTRYDIEALQVNTRRVGLVVRIRWALLAVLVIYSLLAASAYMSRMSGGELVARMAIPAMALLFVVAYNSFYHLNYRRLGNISVWNILQLALDALVVTVIVHYSGSVNSWFWSMYALFILEAAFILPRRRDAWAFTAFCIVLLGALEWLELLRVLPHVAIPFVANQLYLDPVYVAVSYGWQVALLAGTASVASLLMTEQRAERAPRQAAMSIVDEATGLYSRGYFLRALGAEVRRAGNDGRPLHIMFLDIDNFGEFNRRFGIERGDLLLRRIAAEITRCVGLAGDEMVTANLVARLGGEEFAVLLAERAEARGAPGAEDAAALAECLRSGIAAARVDDVGVTVSIGVASLPDDGVTADELLDAADGALAAAVEMGGDRVVVASALIPPVRDDELLSMMED